MSTKPVWLQETSPHFGLLTEMLNSVYDLLDLGADPVEIIHSVCETEMDWKEARESRRREAEENSR